MTLLYLCFRKRSWEMVVKVGNQRANNYYLIIIIYNLIRTVIELENHI